MNINLDEYKQKVLGCWMGKNIGGTLGAPYEWARQVNDVSFYSQELDGNPWPNDDLDLQLLWLIAMEERGILVNSRLLGEYFSLYVTPYWSEYGTAKINMKSGLLPPISGMLNNDFKDSCGSFIRSEIWACIAPGCPETAVKYAYEDAVIDHGNGEGVYAEILCAALESAAFIEKDIQKLIQIGLSYIPQDCGITKAVQCVLRAFDSGKTWMETRDEVLSLYRGNCFYGMSELVSDRDKELGYIDGRLGWDAPSNMAIVIIGLLYGKGDFGDSLCITVNCGEDTDSTAATVGSILGIMHGIDAIPEKWKSPIGRKIKTACLNLGMLGIYSSLLPDDIDQLTDRVERIARQVILHYKLPIQFVEDKKTDYSEFENASLFAKSSHDLIGNQAKGPVYRFDFFEVSVDYGDAPIICDNTAKKVIVKIENKYRIQETLHIHWYKPANWKISPADEGDIYISQPGVNGYKKEIEFELTTEKVERNTNRLVIELTIEGRPTVMLVPIVLLNGNLIQ